MKIFSNQIKHSLNTNKKMLPSSPRGLRSSKAFSHIVLIENQHQFSSLNIKKSQLWHCIVIFDIVRNTSPCNVFNVMPILCLVIFSMHFLVSPSSIRQLCNIISLGWNIASCTASLALSTDFVALRTKDFSEGLWSQ